MHGFGGARGAALPRYGDVPPNQTLYVNNLNDKIKVPEMKSCLLELFATYGEVLDVVAFGSLAKKGQAFVVFNDISCATNAMRALQGFMLLDKPMRIAYAKTKSDVVALEDGSYKPRGRFAKKEEEKKPAAPHAPKQKGGHPTMIPRSVNGLAAPPQSVAPAGAGAAAPKFVPHPGAGAAAPAPAAAASSEGQPSNVLFVENLPAEVNEMMLTMLFRQYPGFQEARLIKGRNVAFIEYSDELQAGIAKHGLQGFMVTPEMSLKISFAKQ